MLTITPGSVLTNNIHKAGQSDAIRDLTVEASVSGWKSVSLPRIVVVDQALGESSPVGLVLGAGRDDPAVQIWTHHVTSDCFFSYEVE